MSVQVKQLTKIYDTQRAVDNISFTANSGEILGFLGPNGAGKTTTMKMITCFLPPTEGSISVCGSDTQTESIEARKKVGYLPEHNPLYKEMYVREYLGFIARLHKLDKPAGKRVDELIEMTGLGREQHKLIGSLSKGYRQRVGLAQAMLHDPDVLILDEPTSGLDPNQLVEIRGLIKQLGAEKTVIFSTHIMQEVQALCDRVLIINQGKLVANDSIESLQAKVAGDTILHVEFAEKLKASQLTAIPGIRKAVRQDGNRWRLTGQATDDLRVALFRFAVDQQLTLLELRKEVSTVESIFQQLTKD